MRVPLGITTLNLSEKSALLLILAIGLIGYGGADYVQQSQALDNAVTVQASVTDAQIDRHEGGQGIEYEPEITYTYEYQGETYTSKQVFPGIGVRTYSKRSNARAVVESYEPGTAVRAYVMPGNPDDAFLIRQRTPLPAKSLAVGSFFLGIVVLAGLGSTNPGQQELRPATEVQPLRPQSWVEQHGETIYRLSTRLLGVCFVMFWVSMVGLFFGVLNSSRTLPTASRPVQADIFGPIGLPLLAGFVFWVGMICALFLYCLWSFSRYQHLRQRLRSPRPPSPFRHPSRLVTILGTENEQLSEYGRRIRVTGWAFTIASGMFVMMVYFVYTAS